MFQREDLSEFGFESSKRHEQHMTDRGTVSAPQTHILDTDSTKETSKEGNADMFRKVGLKDVDLESFRASKRGAKFGIGREVMCDNCKRYFLQIRRCSRCKCTWYCSAQCQKDDWKGHRHICKTEEEAEMAEKRREEERKEKIKIAEFEKKGRNNKKVDGKSQEQQSNKVLEPDARILEKMQSEILGRKVNEMDLSQFSQKELHGYEKVLTEEIKDVLESMWRAFNVAGLVPIDGQEKRSVREMFKFSGSKLEFVWLAKKGEEWLGGYTDSVDSELDKRIVRWIRVYMKEQGYRTIDDKENIDYQTFMRMICARVVDYNCGK